MRANKNGFQLIIVILVLLSGCSGNHKISSGEGSAEVSGGNIWYYVIGEGNKPPLLMMHGGPGGTSYSLFLLGELGKNRPVILFDQIGTGRSGSIKDTSLMNMQYILKQTREFVKEIGVKKFSIYGHSWGCMLGIEYYLSYPEGIESLVLNSPLVSAEMWTRDADTLIATLPDTVQKIIKIHEETGEFDTPEFRYANRIYGRNFILRKEYLMNNYGITRVNGNDLMYEYMWGPSEFTATGKLKNYNRIEDLDEIKIPVLFIAGEYDEARPATVRYFSTLVPQGKFRMIDDAAHGTMHDNQQQNVRVIDQFLKEIEKQNQPKWQRQRIKR